MRKDSKCTKYHKPKPAPAAESDLRSTGRGFDSQPFHYGTKQVVHTHVPLSPSSTIWYRPKGADALRPGR